MLRTIKGFIFDMDGTMCDNMHLHLPIWERIVVEMGGDLQGEELLKELYGKNEDIVNRIFGKEKFTSAEANKWGDYKEALYREIYKGKIDAVPGLHYFLEQAKAAGIKIALGTAGIHENIHFTLEELDIAHYFEVLVGKNDVTQSKPDPETFLLCASKLGLNPKECIVFEDVPKGVECAERAGMRCVVVNNSHDEIEFGHHENIIRFIKDFTQLTPADLL